MKKGFQKIILQNNHYQALVTKFGQDRVIPASARTEYELTLLDEAQKQEMLDMLAD